MKNPITKSNRRAACAKRLMVRGGVAAITTLAATVTALADDPVLPVITNFQNVLFAIFRVLGVILAGFGIVQIALSLSQHDAHKRSNGIMMLIGGLMVIFVKEILQLIGAI